MIDIVEELSREFSLKTKTVNNIIELIDNSATVPFIARYRKEVTENSTDEVLRKFSERLNYLRNRQSRRDEILNILTERNLLNDQLKQALYSAKTLKELEEIYLPFKERRKTKASIAREKGLEPLAREIEKSNDTSSIDEIASKIEKLTPQEAIEGASYIIAEDLSLSKQAREHVREDLKVRGIIRSSQKDDSENNYSNYYEFKSRVKDLKPHQILALFRGEKEGALSIYFEFSDDYNISKLKRFFKFSNKYLDEAIEDSYKRLIKPSIETEVKSLLREYAEDRSIEVFSKNLRPYLMQPPIPNKVVLGLDPGFRTGCKYAVVDMFSKPIDSGVLYITTGNVDKTKSQLLNIIKKNSVDVIAIGNGTASRETQEFVSNLIRDNSLDVNYAIVNESGASIYSASELANQELPEYDVTIRGAISIARRFQDPLSELVKISPEHIGLGQYQHDLSKKKLVESLDRVVEDCVNSVGVDLNTASYRLLSYVSGISEKLAKNIIEYKNQKGLIKSRDELKQVKGLGPKAFEQCAGFLRIKESDEKLDKSAVHPESYDVARKLSLMDLDNIDISEVSLELGVGEYTLKDIIEELKKPSRDPRDMMPQPLLRQDVLEVKDLNEGMQLQGVVRNVADFGAFVDIGLKNDGLIHLSKLSKKFIKHPLEVVQPGEIVDVEVLSIDDKRGKVYLALVEGK